MILNILKLEFRILTLSLEHYSVDQEETLNGYAIYYQINKSHYNLNRIKRFTIGLFIVQMFNM